MIAVPVLEFSHYVMSEIPYLLLSLGALVVGERFLSRESARLRRRSACDLAAVAGPDPLLGLAAAAFYTRTAGAVLAIAFLAVMLARRPPPVAPGGARAAWRVVFLPWLIHALRPGAPRARPIWTRSGS